ncbi:unnamed protein product [Spirodela intermedia]|uniref:Uncharacterized protein n=1 Tax=Spirodela intermedia TaxID=51605 RepID=A0A7I8INE5_SPIIN|nr:unnamed protein product [Spirodela intermedia]CAA6659319.1 unnamed protein product [Spirodela intermedia]
MPPTAVLFGRVQEQEQQLQQSSGRAQVEHQPPHDAPSFGGAQEQLDPFALDERPQQQIHERPAQSFSCPGRRRSSHLIVVEIVDLGWTSYPKHFICMKMPAMNIFPEKSRESKNERQPNGTVQTQSMRNSAKGSLETI